MSPWSGTSVKRPSSLTQVESVLPPFPRVALEPMAMPVCIQRHPSIPGIERWRRVVCRAAIRLRLLREAGQAIRQELTRASACPDANDTEIS